MDLRAEYIGRVRVHGMSIGSRLLVVGRKRDVGPSNRVTGGRIGGGR